MSQPRLSRKINQPLETNVDTSQPRLARKINQPVQTTSEQPIEKKSTDIFLTNYSEKSFVVTGNTIDHANNLGKLGGTFNESLKLGPGWIFANFRKDSVQKYIDTGIVEPTKTQYNKQQPENNEKFKQLFKELRGAFDGESTYDGSAIIDIIDQLEKKYCIVKPENTKGK
jgi:hypothetical protein